MTDMETIAEVLDQLAEVPVKMHQPERGAGGSYQISLPIDPDANEYNGGEGSLCYLAALSVWLRLRLEGVQANVVHGVARIAGERCLHAWVEIPILIGDEIVWLVSDASKPDAEVMMVSREHFYRSVKVEGANVRRYDMQDIRRVCKHVDHCGPWEPPLEPCVDWTELDAERLICGFFEGNLDGSARR